MHPSFPEGRIPQLSLDLVWRRVSDPSNPCLRELRNVTSSEWRCGQCILLMKGFPLCGVDVLIFSHSVGLTWKSGASAPRKPFKSNQGRAMQAPLLRYEPQRVYILPAILGMYRTGVICLAG